MPGITSKTLLYIRKVWIFGRKELYMDLALFLGIAFAVSHHYFHHYVHGRSVTGSTQQQWYGRVSLGFALLVRYCFKIAIGIAITQMFWRRLKRKSTKIGIADDVLKMLNNPALFAKLNIWSFSPPIVLLAFLSWFLPFATIVAPPTLGVANIPAVARILHYPVPRINFNHGDGRHIFFQQDAPSSEAYSGPSLELSRLALVTAGTGLVQPVVAPWTNASYTLTFIGPSLKCQLLPILLSDEDKQKMALGHWPKYYVSGLLNQTDPRAQIMQIPNLFLGPLEDNGGTAEVPYAVSSTYYSSKSSSTSRMLVFFYDIALNTSDTGTSGPALQECFNYNASYYVQFLYKNGQQTLQVKNIRYINKMPSIIERDQLFPNCNSSNSNMSECAQYNYITKSNSILDALTYLLAGWIIEPVGGDGPEGFTPIYDTSLYFVKEFAPTRAGYGDASTPPELERITKMTLIEGIEELFQNITMSLFSRSTFLQEKPPNMPVMVIEPVLVYVYQWRNLIIGYTMAAVFTLVVVGLGLESTMLNQGLYSNSLSTFIRVSRNAELDELVKDEDTDGMYPSPNYLKNTEVMLRETTVGDKEGRTALVLSSRTPAVEHHYEIVETNSE